MQNPQTLLITFTATLSAFGILLTYFGVQKLMPILDEIKAAIADGNSKIDALAADQARVIADLQALMTQPGGSVSVAELQPILDALVDHNSRLDAAKTSLDAGDPPPAPPAEEPAPEEPAPDAPTE